MENVLFTVPIALAVGLIFLSVFYWAWKNGQFDNIQGPAERVIHNDDEDDEK